jgi:hypothetical protein
MGEKAIFNIRGHKCNKVAQKQEEPSREVDGSDFSYRLEEINVQEIISQRELSKNIFLTETIVPNSIFGEGILKV